MRYHVVFQNGGNLKEDTDDKEHALHTARCMDKWNLPCDVIDTHTNEAVYHGAAYSTSV